MTDDDPFPPDWTATHDQNPDNVTPITQAPSHQTPPPHNTEAEAACLGAALLSTDAAHTLTTTLTPDDYYTPTHGHIHTAITRLLETDTKPDPITVTDQLHHAGLAEPDTLTRLVALQANAPGTTNTPHYAAIVRDHATLRRLIGLGATLRDGAYQLQPPALLLGETQTTLDDLQTRTETSSHTTRPAHQISPDHLDLLQARHEGTHGPGATTGLTDLDDRLYGLQPGQLIVIGARPGVGKTDLALQIARAATLAGTPTLFASLEMGRDELWDRLMARQAHIPYSLIRSGGFGRNDWDRLTQASVELGLLPLHVRDDAGDTIPAIRATARRIPDLGLIIIDYLQLLVPARRSPDRRVEVDELSRGLKRLARILEVPVVVLAQLNRGVEGRLNKKPMLSDFRESGAIEADADVAIALYRDELYDKETKKPGVMDICVLKQRAGPICEVEVTYSPAHKTFHDIARERTR